MSAPWTSEELAILRRVEPFASLPAPLLEDTLGLWERCTFAPGEVILGQGSTEHTHLYLVVSGKIRLTDGAITCSSEGGPPGTIFGTPGLLQGGALPYEAMAAAPTVCAQLPAAQFHHLRQEDQAFAAVFQQSYQPLVEREDAGGWVGGVAAGPFAFLQNWHGSRPWGSVLDAGTGASSLRWVLGLPTERWVAVTGEPQWKDTLETMFGSQIREQDRIIVHNWTDSSLLQEHTFDIVIADYLLGAVERFAPYFQDQLWSRLKPHVGQYLYIVGQEPPLLLDPPTLGGQMIQSILRLRDACHLLAGQTNFREYPLSWVLRSLQAAGFVIEATQTFENKLGPRYPDMMLDKCLNYLPKFRAPGLAVAFAEHIETLRQEALSLSETFWGIRFGLDYAVIARPA